MTCVCLQGRDELVLLIGPCTVDSGHAHFQLFRAGVEEGGLLAVAAKHETLVLVAAAFVGILRPSERRCTLQLFHRLRCVGMGRA